MSHITWTIQRALSPPLLRSLSFCAADVEIEGSDFNYDMVRYNILTQRMVLCHTVLYVLRGRLTLSITTHAIAPRSSSTRMSSSGMERPPSAVVPGPAGAIDPAGDQQQARATSARLGLSRQLYNTHQKVSHYVLRHTSHRLRSVVEHAALGLAVCGFCVVILTHRTFVHREDIASISRGEGGMMAASSSGGENNNGCYLGLIGEGRGVSMYSIVVQLIRGGLRYYHRSSFANDTSSSWSMGKKIPGTCLRKIPGFREDADVNHILLRYDDDPNSGGERLSGAFTIHRGSHEQEQIVSGVPTTDSAGQHLYDYCAISAHPEESRQKATTRFGIAREQIMRECPRELTSLLSQRGYHLSIQSSGNTTSEQMGQHPAIPRPQQYSPIVYSYSHTQGFLRLQPSLKHAHNISTQFVIASSTDPN